MAVCRRGEVCGRRRQWWQQATRFGRLGASHRWAPRRGSPCSRNLEVEEAKDGKEKVTNSKAGEAVNPSGRRIRLKNGLGLPGLLVLSGLISVPLASVIGAKYFRDTPGAMPLLMLAFVTWAAALTLVSWGIKHSIL